MEMQNLSERSAITRTIKQLNVSDLNSVRLANILVYETTRRRNFIDAFINQALKPKTIDQVRLGVQAFLRLYVYQTRIAKNWARVDAKEAESIVKLARAILEWKTLQKVEGVLGVLLTQKPEVLFRDVSDEGRVGLLTFHPSWFVRYCFRLFGRHEAIAILEANRQPPPTYIRLNTLKAKEKEIAEKLAGEGITTRKAEHLRHVYEVVKTGKALTSADSFKEGLFAIQDKSSCLAVEAADPKPKTIVLDICASHGAKTTHMAQLMRNHGVVCSIDYSDSKMAMLKAEVTRMGVRIAQPVIANACNLSSLGVEADVVMLTPPSTKTGAFGTVPSAKWKITSHYVDRMSEIQWSIINSAAEKVKPKGIFVYSTNSITVEENEMLIERFLKWHPEFSLTDITPNIGAPGLRGMEKCQRLYPHLHRCNGSFIAKLVKD
jgi:16S rRNA (cytosine967-C5)-methyltransferase